MKYKFKIITLRPSQAVQGEIVQEMLEDTVELDYFPPGGSFLQVDGQMYQVQYPIVINETNNKYLVVNKTVFEGLDMKDIT